MDVCDEKVTDEDGFLAGSMMIKAKNTLHEGTYLNPRGQRACVSASHADTCALARVFNASDNFGKLLRLKNAPKSRQCFVNWVVFPIM